MKKIILLLLLVSSGIINAQNSYKDLPGRWRLGFNMGGIWESSDVKPVPGLGGGFTIEKILNKRSDAFLGFSLGFRYLGGRTFGTNISPTFDLANNKALNGTFNPAVKYDSMPGFFYANHKTFIQEGALELKMNFPSLEKRTGIIFHLWGGIGIGKYKTWIDALDKDGKMYDFSSIRGQSVSQSDLSRVFDKNYETLAQGSGTNGTWAVIPSVGVGLGYRLGKNVSLVFEHKVSFPGTNWLDGIEYPKNCPVTGSKDFYNYTSVGLVFTFYGQHHTSASGTSTNNNVYTSPTQTVAANNTTYVPPVIPRPSVVITYPANNFNSPYDYTTVNASLQNVSSSQQITISQNGYSINHFTYNANNGTLHFQTFLGLGANNFVIVASNQGGTASQGLTINYNPVPNYTTTINNTGNTTVTNTVVTTNTVTVNPVNTNTLSTSNTFTTHITNTVSVNTNTVVTTNTTVTSATVAPTHTTATTHTVVPTFTAVNTGTVVSTNTVSPTYTTVTSETVTSTAIVSPTTNGTVTFSPHGTEIGGIMKPVVTFIDPSVYTSETTADNYNVSAIISNITSGSMANVMINGNNLTGFTYNASTKTVNFLANLQLGYNTITVTGTNSAGSDSKSAIINHKPSGRPPKVSISNPSSSPFTTLQSNVIVSGFVYNVLSSANISVTSNGAPTTFNYNMGTHEINVPLYLATGNTQVIISATNALGSDSKSIELIYNKINVGDTTGNSVSQNGGNNAGTGNSSTNTVGGVHGVHVAPEITVLSPTVDPFYTNTGVISVSANVNYILMANMVNVTYNGIDVSFTYDMNSKHLNFSSPLKPGLNTFIINASNLHGNVSKSINVNYTPIVVNPNPSDGKSNPSSEPTYNHGGWNMGGILNNGGGNANPVNPRINTGNQNPTPKTTNPTPVNSTPVNPTVSPVPNTPRSIKNSGDGGEVKPAGGNEQIKLRPR